MKNCITCFHLKPLAEFYAHPKTSDGRMGRCKTCTKEQAEARRRKLEAENPEWREAELERHRLKSTAARAIGKISKPKPEHKNAWRRRNREKMAAHNAVARAIASGELTRQPCRCGAEGEAHHDDYSKPLEVLWLCPPHHAERHVKLRQERRLKTK